MLRKFLSPSIKSWKIFVVSILLFLAILMLIHQGYSLTWTGFGDFIAANGETVRGKTLWDWMQLFLIPIFLSVGVFFLNHSERMSEREAVADRERKVAFQAYLDRMTDLLLKEKLRVSKKPEVRDVARIRSITVLEGLDTNQKRIVLLFLREAGLITQKPIIDLSGANLNRVDLQRIDLSGVSLIGVNLNLANLKKSNLNLVNLKKSDLSGADLSGADLSRADLSGANLSNANLTGANLIGANLTRACLNGSEVSEKQLATAGVLKGAIMPNGTKHV